MIVLRMMGGLGNQMFQYSLGRRLSERHDVTLKLDTSWYNRDKSDTVDREFTLKHFNIQAEYATDADIHNVTPAGQLYRFTARPLSWYLPKVAGKVFKYWSRRRIV